MSDPVTGALPEAVLRQVEKPGRYTGGEWNAVVKDPSGIRIKVALAFPDVYEIGMSYLGQKILYDLLNRRPDIAAERVFAPWPDFERALRASGIPLSSLETKTPLGEFDVVGFSLLYELNYSNILTMLDLAGLPFRAADRLAGPLLVAGGPAAFNPEPVAGIFDLFVLGDGEEAFLEILDGFAEARSNGGSKDEILAGLTRLPGVYVPRFYEAYRPSGSLLLAVRPKAGAPPAVAKRVLRTLDSAPFPSAVVVPNIQTVFDRVAVEVSRGCPQKCRFCQAANLYAPFRSRNPNEVVSTVLDSLTSTGYADASLFALSVGDFPCLEETVSVLMDRLAPDRVSLSLSSLRPGDLSSGLARTINRVRKTGFTIVPEAGSDRLRRAINKNLTEKEILEAAACAFGEGWRLLKLYVMIGLPTETDEDVEAVPDLVEKILACGRRALGRVPRINLSVSSFIPKPHTPFQWAAMASASDLERKQGFLRRALKRRRSVEVKFHSVESSLLEAVFSRGDRRLDEVLIRAWGRGARFDGWTDSFRPEAWREAMDEAGLDPAVYRQALDPDLPLPWGHIRTGVDPAFIRREYDRAFKAETTASCLEAACPTCRGCDFGQDFQRRFSPPAEIRPPEGPRPVPSPGEARRFRVTFAKEGPARFIGHNDLVQTIQRILRRAGLRPAFTEGFHPKIRLVFGPPLPLGMEGLREVFEFKAGDALLPRTFLEAANRHAPPGFRFLGLEPLGEKEPALHRRIAAVDFRLRMEDGEVRQAFARVAADRGWADLGAAGILRRLAEEASASGIRGPESVIELGPSQPPVLTWAFDPGRPPRPQDFIGFALGLSHPSHLLIRTGFLLSDRP